MRRLQNLFKDESGQDMIEYALLASLIAVTVIAVLVALGPKIVAVFQAVVDAL